MEVSDVVEQHNSKETPLQRLQRSLVEFGISLARTFVLAAIFVPILLIAFLTVDLPFRGLDRFFLEPALRPSIWLSWGNLIMALGPLVAVLFSRRHGGEESSRVITASWGVAALLVFAEISYLAPSLENGDFPSAKFVTVFVISAMGAQFLSASIYDVIRGGGGWWRAPLYSVMIGYTFGGMVYFPVLYWGSGAPWPNWLISDLGVKLLIALAFLPFYYFMRRSLRPRGGFGG